MRLASFKAIIADILSSMDDGESFSLDMRSTCGDFVRVGFEHLSDDENVLVISSAGDGPAIYIEVETVLTVSIAS